VSPTAHDEYPAEFGAKKTPQAFMQFEMKKIA